MRKLVPSTLWLAALFCAAPLAAVSTRSFEFGEFKRWESADLDGVKVSSEGEVSLGLSLFTTDSGAKEVWSSLVAKDGRTWFTTGNGAALHRLEGAAEPRSQQVFRADEVAFSCLAEAPDGRLFVGSLPAGRIYVVDAKGDGKVFTTLPAPYIWGLVFDREGHLLAGTGPEGVIYRISPHGEAKIHYDARDGNILALAISPRGELYAGSAGKGLLYRIKQAGEAEVVWDFKGREIKALAFHGTSLYAAVNDANSRLGTPGARESGRTALEFSNLARKLAGKFEGAEVSQEGAELASESSLIKRYESGASATIGAPAGRYLQAKIEVGAGAESRLTNLRLFYLNQNQKPRVGSVAVSAKTPDDKEDEKPSGRAPNLKKMTEAMSALGGKSAARDERELGALDEPAPVKPAHKASPGGTPELRASPIKEVRWDAADKDGDALVFRLYFQGVGDPDWVPLTPREPLAEAPWSWNTESVPDGRYLLKVVATDERVNPAGETLAGEKSTAVFVIDNTRPAVTVRETAPGRLAIEVEDALSPVARAEVSVDGQEWKPLHPRDRIADGLEEAYDWTLPALPPGPHAVAVRATDAEGNVGASRLFVRVHAR